MSENTNAAWSIGGLAALSLANPRRVTTRGTITHEVCAALDEFTECVRYLNTRRSRGAVLALDSEADVQDALFLILRPWIRDLVAESPSDKVASRFTIRDFASRAGHFVIEVKYVRSGDHARTITKELHDDIEMYRHHPNCDTLIFFVYDPDSIIPDQGALRRQIECARTYDGRDLACRLIVKP